MTSDGRHNRQSAGGLVRIVAWAILPTLLLLVPFLTMRFTDEVNWNATDFVVAGSLIFAAGATYALSTSRSRTAAYRLVVGLLILMGVIVVWTEIAVGIFD